MSLPLKHMGMDDATWKKRVREEGPQIRLDILHSKDTWDWRREEIERTQSVRWKKIRM